ncbi:RcnB family protein [Phenylobacterium sp.]|uniref:RcnB family protein n=1 Tax=Phenylobacterium sp. TaxID=1871053 RepID=UPI002F3F548F
MKKLMTGAMTAMLLASAAAPALAQEGRWRDGGPRNGGGHSRSGAWSNPAPDQAPAPQAQSAPQAPAEPPRDRGGEGRTWDRGGHSRSGARSNPGPDQAPALQARPAPRAPAEPPRDRGGEGRAWDRGDRGNPEGGRNWSDRNGGDNANRDWNRAGRGRTWDRSPAWNGERNLSAGRLDRERPRYDRRRYPPVFRSERRFRGPAYRAPYGFYARNWGYGDILPRGWYGPDYSLDAWWDYGLPVPPVGYEWVRVGDDVVLVDSFTGRVVQVVYGLFW